MRYPDDFIQGFVKDRNEALLSLDKEKIDAYCKKYNVQLPESEKVYWMAVHKAIAGLIGLTGDARRTQEKSVQWLAERGIATYCRIPSPVKEEVARYEKRISSR